MDKDYFKKKLIEIKPKLEQIKSIQDVQNKAIEI